MADLPCCGTTAQSPGEHYLAAGIPWFATLFGRDSIIAALETLPFMPANAIATLDVLARRQATTGDDWTDAEPGKILHELRSGEMARAGETPHAAYYGSVDSTPLWLILLGETHAWTGRRRPGRATVAATPSRRSNGSTTTATSMATASSSTERRSARRARQPGLEGFGRRDPARRRQPRRRVRSPSPRCRATSIAARRWMARLARRPR